MTFPRRLVADGDEECIVKTCMTLQVTSIGWHRLRTSGLLGSPASQRTSHTHGDDSTVWWRK
jgi:hypothetical protein